MSDGVSQQHLATTLQQQLPVHVNQHQLQEQQHEQGTEQLLLGELGAECLVQCQQALHTLHQNGFQVLLQPAGNQLPGIIQLAGNSQADFLQAELCSEEQRGVTTDKGEASAAHEALQPLLGGRMASPHQQGGTTAVAAVAPAQWSAPAVAADAIATIVAPRRKAAKQQPPPPAETPAAASSKQTSQPRKRKAAAAAAAAAAEGTADATETTQEAEAAAAGKADNTYNSQLLAFGQQLSDQVLAHLKSLEAEASAEAAGCIEIPKVMQLLQPIVDRMLQGNAEVLGEPITAEHKAFVADIGRKGGGSAGEGDADGLLRYEQFEQLFSQMDVGEASRHLGIGKTKLKAIRKSFGILRWPYREFCSIYLAQDYLDAKSSKAKAKDAALLPGRRLLLIHALHLLQQHPNMEFKGHPAYVLTQALHKQKHKKRKTEERHADESAAQVLTHIRTASDAQIPAGQVLTHSRATSDAQFPAASRVRDPASDVQFPAGDPAAMMQQQMQLHYALDDSETLAVADDVLSMAAHCCDAGSCEASAAAVKVLRDTAAGRRNAVAAQLDVINQQESKKLLGLK